MKRSNAHEVTLRAVIGMLFMYLCPHLVRRQMLKLHERRVLQCMCSKRNRASLPFIYTKTRRSESDATCGQVWWPILGICALHLSHPKCTHKAVNTHTHREHTPGAVGSHLCSPQSWYWGCRERWLFTPPTYNPCRTWDSNLQPLDYESDSLTIRPRLPPKHAEHAGFIFK